MHEHLRNDIHLTNEVETFKKEVFKDKNLTAARTVVTLAVQSLIEVDWSLQFVRLKMLETLFEEKYPTQKHGRNPF